MSTLFALDGYTRKMHIIWARSPSINTKGETLLRVYIIAIITWATTFQLIKSHESSQRRRRSHLGAVHVIFADNADTVDENMNS